MRKIFGRITVVALLLATLVVGFAACKPKPDNTLAQTDPLNVNMDGNYFVGTSNYGADGEAAIDLTKAFPGESGFACTGDIASVSGNTLSVKSTGDFSLTTSAGTKKMHAVDGVNVTTQEEVAATLGASKNAVFMNDIAFAGKEGLAVKSTIYGNGYDADLTGICAGENKATGFWFEGDKGVIRDLHLWGVKVEANNKDTKLEDFEGNGAVLSASGEGTKPVCEVTHCVVENGQKLFWISSADVTIEGCIFRNGADAIIAVETSGKAGSVLNMKNNVIANSVVAGVLFCGWSKAAKDGSSTCTLNIDGYLDIYNWKGTDTAKLMPNTESFAGTVNGMIGKELGNEKKYAQYFVSDGGSKYIHFGIILLATGDLKANETTINGMETVNYAKQNFPIPTVAKVIAKTCDLIGYTKDSKNIIKPTATISDKLDEYYTTLYKFA